jgi:hypothetical protein
MKKSASFLIIIILCVLSISAVYANDDITECPEIKIVIDGQVSSYTDAPLIVNARTMLPLREVLANLGVANDDEHIIWNNEKRMVTIVTNSKTIVLQIDNPTAIVNGEEITLDVSPMIYSKISRTYIPARFVAETLDKKVVWQDETRAVLVTEEESFNKITEILIECNKAMEEAEKYKMALNYDLTATRLNETRSFSIDVTAHVNDNDDHYMKFLMEMDTEDFNPDEALVVPVPIVMESYQVDDTAYFMTNMFGSQWLKSPVTESNTAIPSDVYEMKEFEDPALASGLVLKETDDTYLLSGNAYLVGYLDTAVSLSAGDPDDIVFNTYEIEFTIDKTTYALEKIVYKISVTAFDAEGIETILAADIFMETTEFNGDFEIIVPNEIVENAVDQFLEPQIIEESPIEE